VSIHDQPTFNDYAEALTNTALRVLSVVDLEQAISRHPRIALNLTRSLSARLRAADDLAELLAFSSVPARLVGELLELMDRYGRVTPAGIRIDARFTHRQLAEMIGTRRETVTKILNELRNAGPIDVRGRLIWVLEADQLGKYYEL
jgi:CRP/FNR family transcriptional regulator, cyclic AMP receptor protein